MKQQLSLQLHTLFRLLAEVINEADRFLWPQWQGFWLQTPVQEEQGWTQPSTPVHTSDDGNKKWLKRWAGFEKVAQR